MPQVRKFKHEETNVSDAIGMSKDSFERIGDITFECIFHCSSPSEIAEHLHQHADYDQILLMATMFVGDRRNELNNLLK
jgi:hypothetical protein